MDRFVTVERVQIWRVLRIDQLGHDCQIVSPTNKIWRSPTIYTKVFKEIVQGWFVSGIDVNQTPSQNRVTPDRYITQQKAYKHLLCTAAAALDI